MEKLVPKISSLRSPVYKEFTWSVTDKTWNCNHCPLVQSLIKLIIYTHSILFNDDVVGCASNLIRLFLIVFQWKQWKVRSCQKRRSIIIKVAFEGCPRSACWGIYNRSIRIQIGQNTRTGSINQ